ncbi:MAG: saccharopine dehydrogenase family protein, partial [Methanobacteriota archaeon]
RRPRGRDPRIRLPYSAATLLDEFTLRPVVLEHGARKEVEPLSGREVVVHPPPFGRIEYLTTLHSELATLPESLGRGVRSMAFKVALSEATAAALEHLVRLGFASTEPLEVGGRRVVPRDVAIAVLSRLPRAKAREVWIVEVVLEGLRSGTRRTAVLRVTGDETQNGTAIGAVVAAGLVRSGRVREPGGHPPERVIPPREFLEGLRAHGLRVSESSRGGGRR